MKKQLYLYLFIASLMIMFIISGCSNSITSPSKKAEKKSGKITIITTFYPMYEFTKNVAKDKANVKLLIPASIEPHDWEPTPKDVASIQKADLFVYNSSYLETWVPSIEKSLNTEHLMFLEASKGIHFLTDVEEHEGEVAHGKHEHEIDPHVWLSPVLAQKEVETITNSLIKVDPKNKEYYEKNSKTYISQLKELDQEYRSVINQSKNKEFITQHAAFGYLAREYGLKQIPISGISPSEEPSPAKLGDLKKFAKKHDIKVIYFEELTSPKVAKTLANEIGAKTDVLSTLEGISEEDQKRGFNYITVMEKNLQAIKKSLVD